MSGDRIWELLSLKLSGEATSLELEELSRLLESNPDAALKAQTLKNIWGQRQQTDSAAYKSFDKHLQRLSSHFSIPALQYENEEEEEMVEEVRLGVVKPIYKRTAFWVAVSAAACLLFFIMITSDSSSTNNKTNISLAKNTVSTKPGTKSRLTLPDGTRVFLNTGSYLTYDETFPANGIREVQLSGEAYFDVVRDVKHPFVIHTNAIDIKVLGTAFNVRSYPNETTTETSLIHGSVEVSVHNNPERKFILKPSEKLIVNNNISASEIGKADAEKSKEEEAMMTLSKMHFDKNDSISTETRWTQDKLVFEATSFMKAIAELERMYNVRFEVKKEKLKKETITGEFENKSLAIVMEALRLSSRFNYEAKDGVVTIW